MTGTMCLADHLTAPTFFGTLSDHIKIGLECTMYTDSLIVLIFIITLVLNFEFKIEPQKRLSV